MRRCLPVRGYPPGRIIPKRIQTKQNRGLRFGTLDFYYPLGRCSLEGGKSLLDTTECLLDFILAGGIAETYALR